MSSIAQYFNENRYVVVKNFLDRNTCTLLYNYCINKVLLADFKKTRCDNEYQIDWDGSFGDPQIGTESYSCYADPLMETLLQSSQQSMESFTGMDLVPQYTYWRLYETGDVLVPHTDRESCEISTTLCIGFNNGSQTDRYNWKFWVKDKQGESIGIDLQPGDMIIYRGVELEHWRDKYQGANHAQVFLHYNDKNGKYPEKFDGRPMLCLPPRFSNKGLR